MTDTLTLDPRLFDIIRQSSIRTIQEALVELLTNADDAYASARHVGRDIWIVIERYGSGTNKSDVIVIDHAKGMTLDEMRSKILVVGGYTADETSRGMIGRGAKDCSNLGDITFTSIVNDKLCSVRIYQTGRSEVVADRDATDEDRKLYQIPVCGTHVRLSVEYTLVQETKSLAKSLSLNVFLRLMLSRPSTNIIVVDNAVGFNERISYTAPASKTVVTCSYYVPGYDALATLTINKTESEVPIPKTPDQIQYGLLVSSTKSVYECSALYHAVPGVNDYRWNSNFRYITGSLVCDYIDTIAREGSNRQLTVGNPYLVFDPNRRNGLVKDHPFTIALYGYAYQFLEVILNRIQDGRDETLLENGSAADALQSLSDFVTNLLPKESFLYTWRSKDDHSQLVNLADKLQNVEMDPDLMGLTWEQVQQLQRDKFLPIEQTKGAGNTFKLTFTTDPTVKSLYQVLYQMGTIVLKVNANDPTIKPYMSVTNGEDGKQKVDFLTPGKAMTAVGAALLEATNNLLVRRGVMNNNTNMTIDHYNEYIFQYNKSRSGLVGKMSDQVQKSIEMLR